MPLPFNSNRSHYSWLAAVTLAAAGVTTASAASMEARVEQAARAHLLAQAERAGLGNPVARVEVVARSPVAAACPQEVKIEPVDTRNISRMRFAAVCSSAPEQRAELVVRGSLAADVVVVKSNVPANRPIAAEQVAVERRDISAAPDAAPDIESVVGKSSRRALRSGQIVSQRWLAEPVLVKRGAAVNIVARNTGVEVQVAGEALEAGRREQVVRVRNVANGAVIRARVIGENTVEPAGGAP